MTVIWGSALAVVLVIVGGIAWQLTGSKPRHVTSSGLVTSFQPGEFKTVPSACSSVTGATLSQYLPGRRRELPERSLYGAAQSQCSWTVDAPPEFRVLQVTVRAYAPTVLATGNGSATAAAVDAYQQALTRLRHPPKATYLPAATLTRLTGTGSDAFAALQVVHAGGDTTDMLTAVVRDRNVLITAVLQGLDHARKGRYGPVSPAVLRAGAAAAARDILTRLR